VNAPECVQTGDRKSGGADERPSSLAIWAQASRPKTLWAGAAPVVVAAGLAHGDAAFHGLAAFCALLGALLIQIGTNFANDYFDFVKGTDTAARVGPTRATQAGWVQPAAMRRATLLTFALVFVPGAYLIARGGWPLLAIGLISIACGILYTAGPYPLAYVGLGDVFVLLFFGPVAVGGAYYVQALEVTAPVLVAGLGPGLISVALLTVNNLRDVDTDRAAGKRTLAVRFGPRFARHEYLACLFGAALAVPLYFYATTGNRFFFIVPFAVFLLARPVLKPILTTNDGPTLNAILARTGAILLVHSTTFALACTL